MPRAIGTTALAILDLAVRVASTSNKYLISDLAVCGELAMAAVRASVHNVRANLADVSDGRRAELDADCGRTLGVAVERIRKLTDAISRSKTSA